MFKFAINKDHVSFYFIESLSGFGCVYKKKSIRWDPNRLDIGFGSAVDPVADALDGQHIVDNGTQIGMICH